MTTSNTSSMASLPSSSGSMNAQLHPVPLVPLPEFWHHHHQHHEQHEQQSSRHVAQSQPAMNGHPIETQQPPYRYTLAYADAPAPRSAQSSAQSIAPASSRSCQQPSTAAATTSSITSSANYANPQQQPLHPSHPNTYYAQSQSQSHFQNPLVKSPLLSSCYYREPASNDNALPIHHHYPVASTSTSTSLASSTSTSTSESQAHLPPSSRRNVAYEPPERLQPRTGSALARPLSSQQQQLDVVAASGSKYAGASGTDGTNGARSSSPSRKSGQGKKKMQQRDRSSTVEDGSHFIIASASGSGTGKRQSRDLASTAGSQEQAYGHTEGLAHSHLLQQGQASGSRPIQSDSHSQHNAPPHKSSQEERGGLHEKGENERHHYHNNNDNTNEPEAENENEHENENENDNEEDQQQYDEAEEAARFSSVSQIEAQPTLDPETGEAIYPCPFCNKNYGGKHARSIWRRHLSNKHGIPLNLQPRRTRWDNDANRPKDEAERHKRTLESKRRWAAKNRAEKRAKRKGTTVEEELGLIEAAEAAEAAAAAAAAAAAEGKGRGRITSNAQDEEHDGNSFSSVAGSSIAHGMRGNQSYHTHYAYAYRDPRAPALASLSSSHGHGHGHGHAAVSTHPLQHPEHMLVHAPSAYWHDSRQMQTQSRNHHYQHQQSIPPAGMEQQQQQGPVLVYNQYHPSSQRSMQAQSSMPTTARADHSQTMHFIPYDRAPAPPRSNASMTAHSQSSQYHPAPSQAHLHTGYTIHAQMGHPDAGHPSYPPHQLMSGPVYALPQEQTSSTRFQRSPSQPEYALLPPQPMSGYSLAASPVDGSFAMQQQQQQQQPQPHQQQQIGQHHHPSHGQLVYVTSSRPMELSSSSTSHQLPQQQVLQTVPLAQQPFLAPPSASSSTLQRSVSAPVSSFRDGASIERTRTPSQAILHVHAHAQTPSESGQAAPPGRMASTHGMTTYIPPPPTGAQAWKLATQLTPAHIPAAHTQNGQNQEQQQEPPTPYYYLSVPDSTPASAPRDAEQQNAPVVSPIISVETVKATNAMSDSTVDRPASGSVASTSQQPRQELGTSGPVLQNSEKMYQATAQNTSEELTLAGPAKVVHKKPHKSQDSTAIISLKRTKSALNAKTNQEAAMQLLALKTASSSPPASPVKDFIDAMENNLELSWDSTDGEGSFADDSGFIGGDASLRKVNGASHIDQGKTGSKLANPAQDLREDDQEENDSVEAEERRIRFASIPPSSPAPRMSLSPVSSPMAIPTVPSKLSATYLRSQASARSTPASRKKTRQVAFEEENDENASGAVMDVEEDDDEGERISLDSSPVSVRDHIEMPPPRQYEQRGKRSLLTSSPVSPRQERVRARTRTHSRSPSPSRYTSNDPSSFATSVTMSTPHPGGLFFSQNSSMRGLSSRRKQRRQSGSINEPSKGSTSFQHPASIFKIDNCSRPSAGLGMASSSSPVRPFLLSSPEHAAVSKSLGLVPEFTNTSLSLPSDSEGFEMHFLRGLGGSHGRGSGLSEYAKDVFGGPLGGAD